MSLRMFVVESFRVAGLMTASDLFAQFVIEKQKMSNWDHWRTIRFAGIGFFFVGPVLTKWYLTLDKIMPIDKKQPVKSGIKKMLIDQSCFSPMFNLSLTFIVPFVAGASFDEIFEGIRNNYFTILGRSYMLWPAAQIINFTYVPLPYQVLYAQVVSFVWNCYLATKLN